MRVFQEADTVVRIFDFDKMRLLVSDPIKRICKQLKINDISPISMVPREHDQIIITEAIQSLWVPPRAGKNQKSDLDDYEFSNDGGMYADSGLGGSSKS